MSDNILESVTNETNAGAESVVSDGQLREEALAATDAPVLAAAEAWDAAWTALEAAVSSDGPASEWEAPLLARNDAEDVLRAALDARRVAQAP